MLHRRAESESLTWPRPPNGHWFDSEDRRRAVQRVHGSGLKNERNQRTGSVDCQREPANAVSASAAHGWDSIRTYDQAPPTHAMAARGSRLLSAPQGSRGTIAAFCALRINEGRCDKGWLSGRRNSSLITTGRRKFSLALSPARSPRHSPDAKARAAPASLRKLRAHCATPPRHSRRPACVSRISRNAEG